MNRTRYLILSVILTIIGTCIATIIIGYLGTVHGVKIDSIISMFGTVMGGLGLAFGAYFALLAVDAYGHLNAIRLAHDKIADAERSLSDAYAEKDKLKAQIQSVSQHFYDHGEEVFKSLGYFVTSLPRGHTPRQKGHFRQTIERTQCIRARFHLSNPHLSDDELRVHILLVHEKIDKESVGLLEEICSNVDRGAEVRANAEAALNYIKSSK